jgi:uncharacterized BrkB/YihY/UPF0761 family membrane protein
VSLKSLTEFLGNLPVVGLFVRALQKSRQDYGKDMAASIAYFNLFSLFPLFLGVIALGSFL